MAALLSIDPRLRQELDDLHAGMCKALSDPKRLLILYSLRDSSQSVSELCEAIGASQPNTSQHLAFLRERGVIDAERRGNTVVYSLRYPAVIEALDLLREVMADELARRQALRAP
ncbi:MAG: metalloregulator ArsR/SmtB family transcription factor [Acidimicrobiia bacterium]